MVFDSARTRRSVWTVGRCCKRASRALARACPGCWEILAGAGLIHSSLGVRQEKEMKVDLGEFNNPFVSQKSDEKPIRRIP